jgi:hypothetical protein
MVSTFVLSTKRKKDVKSLRSLREFRDLTYKISQEHNSCVHCHYENSQVRPSETQDFAGHLTCKISIVGKVSPTPADYLRRSGALLRYFANTSVAARSCSSSRRVSWCIS